jgi:signal transduction histidine kinase
MPESHSMTNRIGHEFDVQHVAKLRLQNGMLRGETVAAPESMQDLSQRLAFLQGAMKADHAARRAALNLIEDAVLSRRAEQQENKQRRAVEEDLRELNRRKDEFLATLAHELRNPLAAIHASAEILQSSKCCEATRISALEILGRQVRQMERLIDDVLEVSRLIQGKIRIRPQPVVLQELLEQAVAAIESTSHKPCHFSLEMPEERIELLADPVRLNQVFSNLFTNAMKYSFVECRIDVRCQVVDDMTVVAVRDHGVGIGPELLPHVFDLFVQGGHLTDRSDAGLGLGLTVVRDLIEKHGGHVEAHSEGHNCGSEFRVYLPLAHPTNVQ